MLRVLTLLMLLGFNALAKDIYQTPTILAQDEIVFADDINFAHLTKAINRQLIRFAALKKKGVKIQLGEEVYSIDDLAASLKQLNLMASQYKTCQEETCVAKFNQAIRDNFNIYKPDVKEDDQGYGKEDYTLFTSYYSPDFTGSLSQTDEFKNAIYKKPEGKLRYSTRVEIDFDKTLQGQGLELFYVKEPLFDLYLMHIEGGGRVKVKQKDGTYRYYYLSYTGNNKQKLFYVYKYMKAKGYLTEDFSINAQREYLNANPHMQREIFETTPSYCFFRISEDEPVGVGSIPLTEKRSAAVDRKFYGISGLIMFVQAKAPTEYIVQGKTKSFSRFFLAQDTGGGIKGRARVDLYSGYGQEAELWANYLKTYGKLYFLALKKELKTASVQ